MLDPNTDKKIIINMSHFFSFVHSTLPHGKVKEDIYIRYCRSVLLAVTNTLGIFMNRCFDVLLKLSI